MAKRCFILTAFFLFAALPLVFADTLTLTTYYPAPFGAYSKMRLVPQNPLPATCTAGTMYVDNTGSANVLRYCNPDNTWGFLPGVWTQDPTTNDVTLTDIVNHPDMKVGIGTNTPDSQLHIDNVTGADATFRLNKQGGSNFAVVSGDMATTLGTTGATALDIRTGGQPGLYISNALPSQCGIGTTTPTHTLEVAGDVQITVPAGTNSVIHLNVGGTEVTMGIDAADSNSFKISWGDSFADTKLAIDRDTGKLTINGKLFVKSNGTDVGEVKLKYIDSGADSGYYALYAP